MGIGVLLSASFCIAKGTDQNDATEEISAASPKLSSAELEIAKINNPFLPQYPMAKAEKPPVPEEPKKTPIPIIHTPPPDIKVETNIIVPQEPIRKEVIKPPILNISGLVWNSDMPQAIINSKILNLGDTIDNAVITNINESGIEILYRGAKFTVPKMK